MRALIFGMAAMCMFLSLPISSFASDTVAIMETVTRLQSDLKAFSSRQIETVDGLEFSVSVSDEHQLMQSQASFVLPTISFEFFSRELSTAANWCNVLLLHFNVKGCVYRSQEERTEIDLYFGRKYYQEPPEASKIKFNFKSLLVDQLTRIELTADSGPYGTSKFRYVLEAIPSEDGVFVVLQLSNHNGTAGRLVDLYLSTLGRSKMGFSAAGKTVFGKTNYVRGQLGAAERNVVRYMLALHVSLTAADVSFFERAKLWFEETEQFPKQLHEMSRNEYLKIKKREFMNQQLLQESVSRGVDYVWPSSVKQNDK